MKRQLLAVLCVCSGHVLVAEDKTSSIADLAGIKGGPVVHVGCGTGRLAASLGEKDGYLIHGLASDQKQVGAAREHILSLGLSGKVSVERWQGGRLPYIDNLVDLIVVSPSMSVDRSELLRVLAPGGKAVFLAENGAEKKADRIVKPWPESIDQWTHYLHGPDNNAVARDSVVGPPRRMQWVAGPRWTRHHNWLNSISAAVTGAGRLFYIVDEASPANMNLPGRWSIVARGAFNGVKLWKKPLASWVSHRQRFRSGPPQLQRLLVVSGERLYVPLGLGEPVSVLDATTGETVATFAETKGAEEIVLTGKTLLVLKGNTVAEHALAGPAAKNRRGLPANKALVAVSAASGKTLWNWTPGGYPLPLTLGSDGSSAYIRLDTGVVCLDVRTGKERWRRRVEKPPVRKKIASYARDNLLVVDGVVLCDLNGMLTAMSAKDGKKLWDCPLGSSFHEPVDIFVIGGWVWHKVGHAMDPMRVPPDKREARDLHTGELKVSDDVPLHLVTQGHHFRCYRAKATERFIIMNKRGVEMLDVSGGNHSRNNWVRGTCQYGVMPANGLLYAPPTSCGCFMEATLRGFWSFAPEAPSGSVEARSPKESERLERGPAYGRIGNAAPVAAEAWPTYRQDPQRRGVAAAGVPAKLKQAWSTTLGGRLTQPVSAGGRVVLADADAGIVYALDTGSGKVLWKHVAAGRVDSPPTIHGETILFGSGDGRVTCLRLGDGELVWRFLAAPADLRSVAFDRLESIWPVSGSVLVLDGVAYVCAGRSTWIDGGMHLYALDPASGKVLHRTRVRSNHPKYRRKEDPESKHIKGHLWTDYKTFTQSDGSDTYSVAGGLADVPVSDGKHIFLRHLMFTRELEARSGKTTQLFATASLLDGTENHRADWGIGTGEHDRMPAARHKGGFSRFHLEDQAKTAPYRTDQPTGLMLVRDADTVWGVLRNARKNPVGGYSLFGKSMDTSKGAKPWKKDLPVRPRAMLKSGDRIVLAVMPKEIPANDPHAAYDGRLGGALWICSAKDGSKLAEYALSSPVRWDGMAAASGRLYLSTTDGRIVCMGSEE